MPANRIAWSTLGRSKWIKAIIDCGSRRLARAIQTPGILLLVCLPLVLLCIDPNWIFPTLIHDPWIYLGYAIDPLRMLTAFAGLYYGDRLTMLLPAALFHGLLPPVMAHCLLHLSLYYLCVFSLYGTVKRELGGRTAFIIALVMGTYFFFLDAVARDYIDAYGITYFLLGCFLVCERRGPLRSGLSTMLAGACTAALIVVNVTYVLLAPFAFLMRFSIYTCMRKWKSVVADLLLFALGAAIVFTGCAAFSRVVRGNFWFLRSSFLYLNLMSLPSAATYVNGQSVYGFAAPGWALSAVWMALPTAVALGSCVFVSRGRRGSNPHSTGANYSWPILYLGLFFLFLILGTSVPAGAVAVLQQWYYADLLVPLMMLALGSLIAGAVEPLKKSEYRTCATAAVLFFLCQAAVRLTHTYPHHYTVYPLLSALAPALIAVGTFIFARGRYAVILGMALLAGSMLASRWGFSEEMSMPIFGGVRTHYTFCPTEGTRRLLPYVQRMHQYDNHKADVYLSIVEAARYVRDHDKENRVLYWFDMLDPHAILYDNLARTRCWGHSVLNFNFPNVAGTRAFDNHEFGAGQLIAIPSVRRDAYKFARLALAEIGFDARLIDRRSIAHGAIIFSITLVVLETRKGASGGVSGMHRGSGP